MGNETKVTAAPLYQLNATAKATVLARCDSTLHIKVLTSHNEQHNAIKALSCLIRPEPGDTVLLQWVAEECWITAVIARQSCATVLELSPGVSIAAGNGNIALTAGGNCRINAGKSLAMQTDVLLSNSSQCRLTADNLSVTCNTFTGLLKRSQLFFEQADVVGTRLMQRLGDSIRAITGTEHIEAGNIMHRVKHSFSCFSSRTFLKSEKEVRVDADEIHMG